MTYDPAARDRDRLARAALTWIAEPGDAQLGLLLRQRSPAAVIAALTAGAPLPAAPAIPGLDRARQRWAARLGDAPTEATVDAWRRDGIRLVCPGDPGWPSQLEVLGVGQPCALWVRGEVDLRFACLRSVSVVGTRAATAYGVHVTVELAAGLAERGWTVLSGGAFGVDSQAHRGALAAEGVTVAVLPSGLDDPYPRSHHELFAAIAGHGALVSEQPPGRHPDQARVPGPQPADCRAQPRDGACGGRAAQRGAEHGPARPGPEPPADGRARPGDVHRVGRLSPGHQGLGSRLRHRCAGRAGLPVARRR